MLYQTKNPHGGDIYGEPVRLDFSANTNPFGTPEGVQAAIRAALPELHRYPDPYCRRLVAAIAEFEGVPEEFILCGSGAAELIYAYASAVRPRTAVELAPTFSEYALGLERAGCRVERFALSEKNGFLVGPEVLDFFRERKPEAVFLCNPNNPTGRTMVSDLVREIADFCQKRGIWLFLDECFLDLTEGGVSAKELLWEHDRLLILKAFTKSYGMAGVRLGYCLSANPTVLGAMAAAVQPWNVSSLAQAAGIAALGEGEFLRETREYVWRERRWMHGELEKLGLWVCPSEANFLLFRGPVGLDGRLREDGIAIRSCSNYHGLGEGWYRVAVRRHEENTQLVTAVRERM